MNRRATTFIRQLGQNAIVGGYGRLYNWYAINNNTFAPLGWHIPTYNEFYSLLYDEAGGFSVAGGHIKETGLTHWNDPNYADNSLGFSTLGAGARSDYNGSFSGIKDAGSLWCSTEYDTTNCYIISFAHDSYEGALAYLSKKSGRAVRCIRPKSFYGALYNWRAVNDARGLAPTNCHIPTITEWNTLTNYLGGDSVAGGRLKEEGILNWNIPNTRGDNSSRFMALPSGYRTGGGSYFDITYTGYWWSSTANNSESAWYLNMYSSGSSRYKSVFSKNAGCAVRCICDTSDETITDIDGNIYDTVVIGTQRWLVQDLKATHYRNGDNITNVTDNTAWAALTTEAYCYYNNSLPVANQPTTVTDYDGNIYDVVEIGRQLWTKPNFKCTHLNDDTLIPEVADNTAWAGLTTGAWCYYNNDSSNL